MDETLFLLETDQYATDHGLTYEHHEGSRWISLYSNEYRVAIAKRIKGETLIEEFNSLIDMTTQIM